MSSKKQKQMAVRELSEVGAVEQRCLHTINFKSLKTKQFLHTFVIAGSELIENSDREVLPRTMPHHT